MSRREPSDNVSGEDESPWVFLHGFTQTHQSWWPTIRALAERGIRVPLDLIDLPGHGCSPPPKRAGLGDVAADLLGLAGAGTYVGYSFGGRVALAAAVADAASGHQRIERLVLISTTAGIDDEAERAARRDADAGLTKRLLDIGTTSFLDEWLASPLFEGLAPTDRSERDTNDPLGLAASLEMHGTGQMMPLWDRLPQVTIPTLIVVGGKDRKFGQLGERLEAALPHSERRVIADAGHSLPIECPDALAAVIAEWLG